MAKRAYFNVRSDSGSQYHVPATSKRNAINQAILRGAVIAHSYGNCGRASGTASHGNCGNRRHNRYNKQPVRRVTASSRSTTNWFGDDD